MKLRIVCISISGFLMLLVVWGASISIGGAIQVIPPETPEMTGIRKIFDKHLDAYSARMIEMNDWMYYNPEPAFLEFKAVEMLTGELRKHGFEIETNIPGLPPDIDRLKVIGGFPADYKGPKGIPTAFKAKYKGRSEPPVICFIVEYDALRGNPPFHGCQHNQQGPAGVGAAIALAKTMEEKNIPGSVWVVGTPAEEVGPPTKALMAQTNYLKGADFVIRSHGTPDKTERELGGFACCCGSIRQLKFTFHGRSAHASRAWQGASALDAVLLLFHGINMLRQVSEPQFRFMGIISDGGVAPNIIPALASATIWVRHFADETKLGSVSPRKAQEMIDAKVEQVKKIAEGAALATGTKVESHLYGVYMPGISVGVMNDLAFQYSVDYGGANVQEKPVPADNRGWDETGMLSVQFPGTQVAVGVIGGRSDKTPGHSMENANITISPAGHKGVVLTGKVMGAVGLRLLLDPDLRKKAKEEHSMWLKKYNE